VPHEPLHLDDHGLVHTVADDHTFSNFARSSLGHRGFL